MADDLPTEYEDIILGTGLQESILAAALARIGRRVLHFDRNNYYSGEWASFHLQGILDWIDSYEQASNSSQDALPSDETSQPPIEDGLHLLAVPKEPSRVFNLCASRHVREAPETPFVETENDVAQPVADNIAPLVAENRTEDDSLAAEVASHQETDTHDDSGADPDPPAGAESLPPSPVCHSAEDLNTSQQNDHQESEASREPQQESLETSDAEGQGSHDDLSEGNNDNIEETGDEAATLPTGEGDMQQVQEDEDQQLEENEAAEAVRRKVWTWKELLDQWRRFNIDLAPKLMFCRGAMVDLLVQSRISRYAEFKAVSRLLTVLGGKLEYVPCSRSDVFSSRYVSMLEKRMLMKLIEFVLHYQDRADDYEGYKDKPFSEFLQKRKLTSTLQHFVIHSIAMVSANTPTEEALQAMQYFLKSLGRYGNTAFLWTLYGSGELPQCFCRMSAVFGGIYMLRTTADYLIVDDTNVCRGMIDSEGRRLTCKNVIMDHSYTTTHHEGIQSDRFVSRAVLITDKTVRESENEEVTFLTIPPLKPAEEPVRVLEIGHTACASPKGTYVVHLTRKCSSPDAKTDLMPAVELLCQSLEAELDYSCEKPKVLWSMFFSYQDKSDVSLEDLRAGQPGGVHVTGGPGCSVGYEHAVKQAKQIFEQICPGEEFLPPAPNPEDIIYDEPSGDNPGHSNKAGFEDNPGDELKPEESRSGNGDQFSEQEIHKCEDEGGDDSPTPEAAENVGKESSTKDENQTETVLVESISKEYPQGQGGQEE